MKLRILEFNKSNLSIDEFSDLIQETVNNNNDISTFRAYESPSTGSIFVEMVFGNTKSNMTEVIGFGPSRSNLIIEQLSATLELATKHGKHPKFVGLVPLSMSSRSVGFIVLEKHNELKGTISAQSTENKKTEQNSNIDRKSNRRKKNSI